MISVLSVFMINYSHIGPIALCRVVLLCKPRLRAKKRRVLMFEVKNRRQRRLCSRPDKENTEPITESSAPSVENPESAHVV